MFGKIKQLDRSILIYIGEIGSGKTTSIKKLVDLNPSIRFGGILTPVALGQRFFFNVKNGSDFEMIASEKEKEIITVGKYVFSQKAFLKAEKLIYQSISDKNDFTIIDEIGPLELSGKGFANVLKYALENITESTLIIAVRITLLDEVISHFNMNKDSIILVSK